MKIQRNTHVNTLPEGAENIKISRRGSRTSANRLKAEGIGDVRAKGRKLQVSRSFNRSVESSPDTGSRGDANADFGLFLRQTERIQRSGEGFHSHFKPDTEFKATSTEPIYSIVRGILNTLKIIGRNDKTVRKVRYLLHCEAVRMRRLEARRNELIST